MLSAATAFVFTRMQPDIYQSHATLMVGSAIQDPNPDNLQIQLGSYLARTYAGMAQRTSVRQAAMDALGLPFLPEYTVRAVPETQWIEIAVVDTEPVRAQAVAQALVEQIVALGPGGTEADDRARFVQSQLASMQMSIAETEAKIREQQANLERATSARQIVTLETEINALEAKLASLRNNYATLFSTTQTGATNAVHVLEQPSLPLYPINRSAKMLVLLAGMAGVLLAAAGVFAMDLLDGSIRSVKQVEEQFGLTPLGALPLVPDTEEEGRGVPAHTLPTVAKPHSPAAEAYRVLRANLRFVSINRPLRVLQISSPTPGDGKSEIAANLAIAMGQAGMQVILVDGDLRRPSQHRIFGLPNNAGLTTALIGSDQELAVALQPTGLHNVTLLPSGPLPPNPAELVGSERMAQIMSVLQGLCDIVILDSPPVGAVADTAVLASQVDGVLLVVWVGRTRREHLRHATDVLRQAHAPVLGVAFNNAQGGDFAPLYNPDMGYEQYYSMHLHAAARRPARRESARPDAGRGSKVAATAAEATPTAAEAAPNGDAPRTQAATGVRRPPFLRRDRLQGDEGLSHE